MSLKLLHWALIMRLTQLDSRSTYNQSEQHSKSNTLHSAVFRITLELFLKTKLTVEFLDSFK